MVKAALKMRTKKMAINKLQHSLFILKKKNFHLSKSNLNSRCLSQKM